MLARMWERAFLATSVAVGEPLEAALAALGEGGVKQAAALAAALGNPSREVRARGMAKELAVVVAELERAELTWRA